MKHVFEMTKKDGTRKVFDLENPEDVEAVKVFEKDKENPVVDCRDVTPVDWEKTIAGLNALFEAMNQQKCWGCSHSFVDAADEFGQNILADACELLEPVEPITQYTSLPFYEMAEYLCGNCHNGLDKMKDKFCSVCGRKIKWE